MNEQLKLFVSPEWCSAKHLTLWSHHNGRDGIVNHQPHHCLLNRLFRHRSKKTLKLRFTGLCAGNSLVTGEFPAQRASNAENVSIWWHHHDIMFDLKSKCLAVHYMETKHCLHRLNGWKNCNKHILQRTRSSTGSVTTFRSHTCTRVKFNDLTLLLVNDLHSTWHSWNSTEMTSIHHVKRSSIFSLL